MTTRLVVLTGQSDPGTCRLSPAQHRFTAALPVDHVVPLNFPYDETLGPWRPTTLVRASWQHARLYAASRRRAWADTHVDRVVEVLSSAESGVAHTVVLAGSIGLDLLRMLRIPAEVWRHTDVVAYGATTRWIPPARVLRIRGRQDLIAVRHRDDVTVGCGHLGYLEDPDVLREVVRFIGTDATTGDLTGRAPGKR